MLDDKERIAMKEQNIGGTPRLFGRYQGGNGVKGEADSEVIGNNIVHSIDS